MHVEMPMGPSSCSLAPPHWCRAQTSVSPSAARLAQALCALERYDEARRFIAISQEMAAAGDVVSQVIWRGAEAKVLARGGDHEASQSLALEAVDLASRTDGLNMQGDILVDLAEVQRAAGHPDEARGSIRKALSLFEQKGNVASANKCSAVLQSDRLARGR